VIGITTNKHKIDYGFSINGLFVTG